MQPHSQPEEAGHTALPQGSLQATLPLARPPHGAVYGHNHASDADLALLLAQRRAAPGPQANTLAQLQQQPHLQQLLAHLLQRQMRGQSPLEHLQQQQQQQRYLPLPSAPGNAVLSALQQHLGLTAGGGSAELPTQLPLRDSSSEEVPLSLGPAGLKVRMDEQRWGGGWGGGMLPQVAGLGPPNHYQHPQHPQQQSQLGPVPLRESSMRENSSEEVFFSLGPTGLKIRVVCNDVRGILYLDDQYVSCFCPDCEARVRAGHDRPIFGLSRFEKHCGSKAKKWRTSLRVEPGSCPEIRPQDAPMPVGQYLALKGVGLKSKAGRDGNDSDQEFMPAQRPKKPRVVPAAEARMGEGRELERAREGSGSPEPPLDRANTGSVAAALMHLRQEAGPGEGAQGGASPVVPGMEGGAADAGAAPAQRSPQAQRAQVGAAQGGGQGAFMPFALQGPGGTSLSMPTAGAAGSATKATAVGRAGSGEAAAAAAAGPGRGAAGAAPAAAEGGGASNGRLHFGSAQVPEVLIVLDTGSPVTQDWMQQQRQRFEGLAAAQQGAGEGGGPGGAQQGQQAPVALSAKHAAIFRLVFGLLQGPNQSIFNEYYMPWLNDLSSERLDREFGSFTAYLAMLGDMPWRDVWRQIMAYLQGSLRRIVLAQSRQPLPAPPAANQGASLPAAPTAAPVPQQPAAGAAQGGVGEGRAAGGGSGVGGGGGGSSASPKKDPGPKQEAGASTGAAGEAGEGGPAEPQQAQQQAPAPATGGAQPPRGCLPDSPSFVALQEYLAKVKEQQAEQAAQQAQHAQQQPGAGPGLSSFKDSASSLLLRAASAGVGGGGGSGGGGGRVSPLAVAAAAAVAATRTAFQPYSAGGAFGQPSVAQQAQQQLGGGAAGGGWAGSIVQRLAQMQRSGSGNYSPQVTPRAREAVGSVFHTGSTPAPGLSLPDRRASPVIPQELNGVIAALRGIQRQHEAQQAQQQAARQPPGAGVVNGGGGGSAPQTSLPHVSVRPSAVPPSPWASVGANDLGATAAAALRAQLLWGRGKDKQVPGGGSPAPGSSEAPKQQAKQEGRLGSAALPPGEPMEGLTDSGDAEARVARAGDSGAAPSPADSESTQSEGAPPQQQQQQQEEATRAGSAEPSARAGGKAAAPTAGAGLLLQKQGSAGRGLHQPSPSGSSGAGMSPALGFGSIVLPFSEASGGPASTSGVLDGASVASAVAAVLLGAGGGRALEPLPEGGAEEHAAHAECAGRTAAGEGPAPGANPGEGRQAPTGELEAEAPPEEAAEGKAGAAATGAAAGTGVGKGDAAAAMIIDDGVNKAGEAAVSLESEETGREGPLAEEGGREAEGGGLRTGGGGEEAPSKQ